MRSYIKYFTMMTLLAMAMGTIDPPALSVKDDPKHCGPWDPLPPPEPE